MITIMITDNLDAAMTDRHHRRMTAPLMTRVEAAAYLGITPAALAQHASRGTGPQYAKLSGRAVRYRVSDLDDWVESKLRDSTSNPAA